MIHRFGQDSPGPGPYRLQLFAAFLAGCTAELRESDLLRPQRGGKAGPAS